MPIREPKKGIRKEPEKPRDKERMEQKGKSFGKKEQKIFKIVFSCLPEIREIIVVHWQKLKDLPLRQRVIVIKAEFYRRNQQLQDLLVKLDSEDPELADRIKAAIDERITKEARQI